MEIRQNIDSIILIFTAFYFHSSIKTNKYSLKRTHLSHCLIDCIHCGSCRCLVRFAVLGGHVAQEEELAVAPVHRHHRVHDRWPAPAGHQYLCRPILCISCVEYSTR